MHPADRLNVADPLPGPALRLLLAHDPGEDQGYAAFRAEVLIECGLGPIPEHLRRPDTLVQEKPWIRPQRDSKANPNDLIELAIHMVETRCGLTPELRVRYKELVYYYPHQWKGNADKDQVEGLVLPALTRPERDALRRGWGTTTRSKQHNVTEAVGLGLHHLRRLRG